MEYPELGKKWTHSTHYLKTSKKRRGRGVIRQETDREGIMDAVYGLAQRDVCPAVNG